MKLYGTMSVCKSYVASEFKSIGSKGFETFLSHLPQLQHFMSFHTGKKEFWKNASLKFVHSKVRFNE